MSNNPKLPESKNNPKKLKPPPIKKKRIITNTPPPGMGFKKGDPAPQPNKNNQKNRPITPTEES